MGCDHFGNHIYPLTGTVFEKTTTPLRTWFYAMYLMGSTGCGISAKQIQRETGVTYKTAWRMFTQTRLLLSDDRLQLEGSTVEMVKPTTAGSVAAIIGDRKSTRLNSSHPSISYAVFCLKKKRALRK